MGSIKRGFICRNKGKRLDVLGDAKPGKWKNL